MYVYIYIYIHTYIHTHRCIHTYKTSGADFQTLSESCVKGIKPVL